MKAQKKNNVPQFMDPQALTRVGILAVIAFGFYLAVYLKNRDAPNPHFFIQPENLSNLFGQAALVGILACAMTLVIVSGNIDLSVGSLLGMLGAGSAWLMWAQGSAWDPALACVVIILVGALCGAVQGAVISWLGVPAFVVTLGGLLAFRGILLHIARRTIPVRSDLLMLLGAGDLPASAAWWLGLALWAVYTWTLVLHRAGQQRLGIGTCPLWLEILKSVFMAVFIFVIIDWLGHGTLVPVRFVVMLILAVVIHILATRFRFGRHVYAIGGNEEAARYSGIRVQWHVVGVFAIMGAVAGLAGLVNTGHQMAAAADAGDLMELYAIAACVIGGTSLRGGRGTVFGAIIGALIMATIRNGLNCLGVLSAMEKIVLGVILVAAVALDLWLSRKRGSPR